MLKAKDQREICDYLMERKVDDETIHVVVTKIQDILEKTELEHQKVTSRLSYIQRELRSLVYTGDGTMSSLRSPMD
jgi:hypothetical protein